MHKNTSKILGLTIATILTASVLALTLSNQAFAQPGRWIVDTGVLGHIHQTQFGKELGQTTKSVLGDVCLSCWNGFAAHETQQANELAGQGALLGQPANGFPLPGQIILLEKGALEEIQHPLGNAGEGALGSGATLGQPASNSGQLGGSPPTLGSNANTQCPNLSPANSASSSSEPFRCIG